MTPAARRGALLIGLMVALPALFFHDVVLLGRALLLRDLFNWFYPWREFARDSLARGDLPLWNPYSYAGSPFLANMQSGLLYPPNLFFWLLDFPSAMRFFLVAQTALATGSMYALMRALSCRPAAAMTSAIAWACGGWMVVHVEFPNKLAAAGWMPLIILGMVRWWQGRPGIGLAIGSLGTALSITAGYPQTTFTLLLGAGLCWLAGAPAVALESARAGRRRDAVGHLASLPAIAALGGLASLAQILPFAEALSQSAQGQPHATEKILELGLAPAHFLDLVYPRFFGMPGYLRYWGGSLIQYWLGHFFVGTITLGLAAAGAAVAFRRVRRHGPGGRPELPLTDRRLALCPLAILAPAVLFCLGDRTPLAPLCIEWLPGFDHFKWLSTTSILIAFALCWLAGIGMERILSGFETGSPAAGGEPLVRPGPIAALLATCGLGAMGAVAWLSPGSLEGIVRWVGSGVIQPLQAGLISANLAPLRSDAIRAAALAGAVMIAWLAARSGRLSPALFSLLLPAILFFDLKAAASGVNHAGDAALYGEVPQTVWELRLRSDPLFRVYVPVETLGHDRRMYGSEDEDLFRWASGTLLFNLNLPHRLFSASDGDPIRGARMTRYLKQMEADEKPDVRSRLASVANVGVILKAGDRPGTTQKLDVPVYLPRVYVASGARFARAEGALEGMLEPDWHPLREVLVEEDFPGQPRAADADAVEHRVTQIAYTNNSVTIDLTSGRDGYLVLADAWYPGWRAALDGRPVPIFRANYLFRGIDLPAGRHRVVFSYRSTWLAAGLAGSVLGVGLIGWAGWSGRASRLPVVGAPVVRPPAPEQPQHRDEDRRPHHGVDGGKIGPPSQRQAQQRRKIQLRGRPSSQGRADEAQRDGAQAPDGIRTTPDPGADRPADGGHDEDQDPEKR